ncbi:prenylated rab acceptor PRA1 [Kalaharituber pfeilii]|nr:prenylated rab acceptor PRA1 [Kalaharituber pfeilii]
MSGIYIPIAALTERLNFGRFAEGAARMPLSNRFSNIRPLREFFDFRRVSKPADFAEVQSRVNYNLSYFSSNYAVIFVLLSIYSLFSNILLLFVIVLAVGGMWGIGRLGGSDLTIGSTTFTSSQLYTGLFATTAILGLFASPFSTILRLLGASGVVILGHASFMDKPIENAFSEEAV